MHADIARILLSREQIHARVQALAREIGACYADDTAGLTLVPILSGAIVFLADLIRELPLRMRIGLVHLSTYKGAAPGEPRIVADLTAHIGGRNVLIVDDILDTGRTLGFVQRLLRERNPASLRTAVLLRKPGKAPPDVRADFVGFDIADEFVVGYGLDYCDLYRNFPHLGVLRPELTPDA